MSVIRTTLLVLAALLTVQACLAWQYSGFNAIISRSIDDSREALIADLLNGVIDLIFWDNISTVPAGTRVVGEPTSSRGPDTQGLEDTPETG